MLWKVFFSMMSNAGLDWSFVPSADSCAWMVDCSMRCGNLAGADGRREVY